MRFIIREKTKTCTRCGTEKPISDFGEDTRTTSGHKSICRTCDAEASAERYQVKKNNLPNNEKPKIYNTRIILSIDRKAATGFLTIYDFAWNYARSKSKKNAADFIFSAETRIWEEVGKELNDEEIKIEIEKAINAAYERTRKRKMGIEKRRDLEKIFNNPDNFAKQSTKSRPDGILDKNYNYGRMGKSYWNNNE